jgi:hypothetical protein
MDRRYALLAAAVIATPLLALAGMHPEVAPHHAPNAPATTRAVHPPGVEALISHRQ